MRRVIVFSGLLILMWVKAYGTHQRAGEITYRHIAGMTYEVTLVTYTYSPSPADRPQLDINWGDGNVETVNRDSISDITNVLRYNRYRAVHIYSAASTYIISMEDPNRNGGVLNIPGSVNIPFYIESTLVINPFFPGNNSPVLLNPPVDNACVYKKFITNPGAYDVDGDSLSYSLVTCLGAGGQQIPGYTDPQSTNGIFEIDPITGDIVWDAPPLAGEYNIAILVKEYRNGLFIGSILRDMQIHVVPCDNMPPILSVGDAYCVVAGELLLFNVSANDPNQEDSLYLTVTGGPFLFTENPAFFGGGEGIGSVSGLFSWIPDCSQISLQPYYVYFKVRDNSNEVSLIDIKTVSIEVLAPPVNQLSASRHPQGIELQWDALECGQVIGYSIYRKAGDDGLEPDACQTGIPPEWGYQLIATIQGATENTYLDPESNNMIPGVEYCYRIVALLAGGVQNVVSEASCASIARDVPLITNVSIRETSQGNGSLQLIWSKPAELDVILYPPPYEYRIYRGEGFNPINLTEIGKTFDINDTLYVDTLINTLEQAYTYQVLLYSTQGAVAQQTGQSPYASSAYLKLAPGNNKVKLSVEAIVPWTNIRMHVFRQDSIDGPYSFIGSSEGLEMIDAGVLNDSSYCYYVEVEGSYFSEGLADPLFNLSQKKCIIVKDTLPPCPVNITITTDCDYPSNTIEWSNPCDNDIELYEVYYSPVEGGTYQRIAVLPAGTFLFFHGPLPSVAGCYYVRVLGANGKYSESDPVSCVDIDQCDLYHLPNVFTPDGDMINDLLIPFPYNFVERIDLTIFNRWGNVVFMTNDPDINWNGRHYKNDMEVSDGVYYYICNVFEIRLSGLQKRTLTGFIHIIRSTNKIKN